jgi:pimeloyl-ACP methyl ester carboxylesterase
MEKGSIITRDGTALRFTRTGDGHPLILIPGWSQSAAEFGRQIDDLSSVATVYQLDMRGHGRSDKPPHGYRISGFAADLHDAIVGLGLKSVDVLGHSMGCSVIWSYLDLFGPRFLRKLVLVDQAPTATSRTGWSSEENSRYGVLFPTYQALTEFCASVHKTSDVAGTKELLRGMFTQAVDEKDLAWIAEENLALPRSHAVDLLYNHCLLDWRDLIQRITLPTFVVGAEKSIFSAESQRWIASVVPGAELSIFTEAEGGSHFMFFENPKRFNAEVKAFITNPAR